MHTMILAAHFFTSLLAGRVRDSKTKMTSASFTVAALLLSMAAVRGTQLRLAWDGGILPLVIVAVVTAGGLSYAQRYVVQRARLSAVAVAMIIPLMLGIAVPQWIVGESARSHTFQSWARNLESKYPNLVLGGDVGIQVALWTAKDAYLEPQANGKWRVTHILSSERDDTLSTSTHQFPEVMRLQHPRLPDAVIVRQTPENNDDQN